MDTRLAIDVPVTAGMKLTPDVVFKRAGETELRMDVYAPPNATQRPAILLVSGAPATRDWGLYKEYGRLIAGANLVAVIADKRYPQGQPGMEQGAEDTLSALTHLRENAATYGIDPTKICLWTFSAGGALAQVGLDPRNGFRCVVAYYGVGAAGTRIQIQRTADRMPPLLVVRAGRDNPQTNNAIDTLASLALMVNAPVTVVNYPAGLHAFEVVDFRPEVRSEANVAETRRILTLTLDWIGKLM